MREDDMGLLRDITNTISVHGTVSSQVPTEPLLEVRETVGIDVVGPCVAISFDPSSVNSVGINLPITIVICVDAVGQLLKRVARVVLSTMSLLLNTCDDRHWQHIEGVPAVIHTDIVGIGCHSLHHFASSFKSTLHGGGECFAGSGDAICFALLG